MRHLYRLYKKLAANGTDDHYFHAHYARRLHECGRYKITDIEATADGHDVDIQLDGWINIQVWRGMNTAGHVMESTLHPDTPKSKAVARHLGTPTELGGVPTDYDLDKQKILAKLA